MTNPVNYSNQTFPAYSGVTINITSPTLNAAPLSTNCTHSCAQGCNHQPSFFVEQPAMQNPIKSQYNPQQVNGNANVIPTNPAEIVNPQNNLQSAKITSVQNPNNGLTQNNSENQLNKTNPQQEQIPQSYPPQYYLNNYNYIQNGEKNNNQTPAIQQPNNLAMPFPAQAPQNPINQNGLNQIQEEDLSSSQGIINELDSRVAEQKELEKNGTKTKVVALTNEYIMSLENYLNNPNTEIRLMASKEILTRLDEDKTRFDDAALNALLNKMLQDPEKLVRIAALSAFSSQLASGNDYTVKLLTDIQNNPNSDKEDALQAADSLLKMSSSTEIRLKPAENNSVEQQPTTAEQQ